MKKSLTILISALLVICMMPIAGADSISHEKMLEAEIAVWKDAQLSAINPETQYFKSAYLTKAVQDEYGFSFSYTPDQSWELPEDFLVNSSTDELVMAVFANPNMYRIGCFADYNEGFERVYSEFNGLRELLSRSDAGASIAKIFSSLSIPKNELPTDMLENFMIQESFDIAVNMPQISQKLSEKEKRAIRTKAEKNFIERADSVYTTDYYVKTAVEEQSELMFDLTSATSVAQAKVFVPFADNESLEVLRSSDTPTWWDYNNFEYRTRQIKTKGEKTYTVRVYQQDFSDATRRAMDALMRTNYSLSPCYFSTGNASATVIYNCHAFSLDNYRFYTLGSPAIHESDPKHTGTRASTTDALTDSSFQNAIRTNDILIDRGHSMKVVSGGWNIVVRDKWDSKGEYQYSLGTRTPYYTPSFGSGPNPYPLYAIYLK